jgi:hypothetical protein
MSKDPIDFLMENGWSLIHIEDDEVEESSGGFYYLNSPDDIQYCITFKRVEEE